MYLCQAAAELVVCTGTCPLGEASQGPCCAGHASVHCGTSRRGALEVEELRGRVPACKGAQLSASSPSERQTWLQPDLLSSRSDGGGGRGVLASTPTSHIWIRDAVKAQWGQSHIPFQSRNCSLDSKQMATSYHVLWPERFGCYFKNSKLSPDYTSITTDVPQYLRVSYSLLLSCYCLTPLRSVTHCA